MRKTSAARSSTALSGCALNRLHMARPRAYAVLTYRCVDGLTIEEIEPKLGLSRRQVYREFSKGVEAVAAQLQTCCARGVRSARQATTEVGSEASPSRRELAEAELTRLRKEMRSESLDLRQLVESLCALLNARLQPRGLQFDLSELHPTPPVLGDARCCGRRCSIYSATRSTYCRLTRRCGYRRAKSRGGSAAVAPTDFARCI